MKVDAKWVEGMAFDIETGTGHTLRIDARPEVGGQDTGPRAKELLLASLAGCTAMDVISILKKMRQPVESFRIHTEAYDTEEHPKVFPYVDLVYEVNGEGLDPERVVRAVELSQVRYCGVSAMLRPAVDIRVKILVNGQEQPVPESILALKSEA